MTFLTIARAHRTTFLKAFGAAIAHHEVSRGSRASWTMVHARMARFNGRASDKFSTLSCRGDSKTSTPPLVSCTERTIKAHRHMVMEKMQVHPWRTLCPCRAHRRSCVGSRDRQLGDPV